MRAEGGGKQFGTWRSGGGYTPCAAALAVAACHRHPRGQPMVQRQRATHSDKGDEERYEASEGNHVAASTATTTDCSINSSMIVVTILQ